MAIQVFRTNQQLFEVGALTVNQMAWFKGNEVAACIGHARPNDAVRVHMDNEDKKTYSELAQGYDETTSPFTSVLRAFSQGHQISDL